MSEQQILEAELVARQKEVAELEATLANLNKELETLQQLLIQRQETGPSQQTLPETLLETPIIRTPSVADSVLSMTYREWKPTLTIEPAKVAIEKPVVLAEAEPLVEKILFLDWWKNNWPWVATGFVGFILVITLAKD